MIFDNNLAENLYLNYIHTGDVTKLEDLHKLAAPLIATIANSVSSAHKDDLQQEAHIKLQKIATSNSFSPDRSSLYNFLSSVLRNCMIDFLRKQRDHAELQENSAICSDIVAHVTDSAIDVGSYAKLRFPSLHPAIAKDMAEYIQQAISEQVSRKSRGTIATLELWYPLDRSGAYVAYHAIATYMRCMSLKCELYYPLAISKARLHEFTLLPELYLITGEKAALAHSAFRNCQIKFQGDK